MIIKQQKLLWQKIKGFCSKLIGGYLLIVISNKYIFLICIKNYSCISNSKIFRTSGNHEYFLWLELSSVSFYNT